MNKFLKKPIFIFLLILALGLFFRTYQIVERYEFSHDADLYSWIVKDIVVNKHFRLIGQETSAQGIFIGPLFYYTFVPFFLVFNMDPIAALVPAILLGALTLISFYFVFTKLFNEKVGLIITFLQATLLTQVGLDRWVVPTIPTTMWAVWYFYCLVMISRGNYKVLPILGVLIGLIWHIHIALFPALLAIPISMIASKKIPNKKQIFFFFITLFITSLPLIIFELKHNFSQFNYLIYNFQRSHGGVTGLEKLNLNILKVSKNIDALLFYPQTSPIDIKILIILILLSPIILIKKGVIKLKEVIPLIFWILGVVIFFTISSAPVSEYYFTSFEIIFLSLLALIFYQVYTHNKIGKLIIISLLITVAVKNLYFFITRDYYYKGYKEKKASVSYIKNDAANRKFPCIAISYITPPGEGVGFRYFFWLNKMHVNQSWSGSPVYTIVIPDELAEGAIDKKFGHVGVILPDQIPQKPDLEKSCSGQNSNLTDPLFGYTE